MKDNQIKEIPMTYTKPELVWSAEAVEAIQSTSSKDCHLTLDSDHELATTAAYEADE
jgi:hypothetical protein